MAILLLPTESQSDNIGLSPEMIMIWGNLNTDLYKCDLILTSGRRNPEENRRVRGAKNSRHLYGDAVDFVAPKCSRKRVFKALYKHCMGIGLYDDHYHCDVREEKVIWIL